MSKPSFYVFDATAFCYRAFYALQGLSTSYGQPTNAVYGFINILNRIIRENKPDYLSVCFDVSKETFRQKKFAEYKITRPPMPDGLSSQIPIIKEIVQAYNIESCEKEGYEADDIIATLAVKAAAKGLSVSVVSSDKDMLQLVAEDIRVLSPFKDKNPIYDPQAVEERYGVAPDKITEVLALMGDDIDNIPGIPGIGEKTAVALIKEFASVENLITNAGKVKKEKLRESIIQNEAQIRLNKELVTLDRECGFDFVPEQARKKEPDYDKLFAIFKKLEFKALAKDLPVAKDEIGALELSVADEKQEKQLLAGVKQAFVYQGPDGALYILPEGSKQAYQTREGHSAWLDAFLSDDAADKTGYDLKKMKVLLGRQNRKFAGLCFDLMIAAYLINPSQQEYQLHEIAWNYLGKHTGSGELSPQAALRIISDLKPVLAAELEKRSLLPLFSEIEMPLCSVLADMELTGIRVDAQMLEHLSKELQGKLTDIISRIYGISAGEFNINSPQQLREVLFNKLKLPIVKKTKTGPSTDEEVLRTLSLQHELPALILEYRQLVKLKTTYIDVLPALVDEKTGRIHTCFNQAVTETGRLSSSNPNLQNIPVKTELGRTIRQSIIALGPESVLFSCDYSQIELRILAHYSQDKTLMSAFLEDLDVHRMTAALINGVKQEDVTQRMREMAKRVNFGISYGLTSFGLSRDLGIPMDQAQAFIDAYFARYPGIKDYMNRQIELARSQGFVSTIMGRRRYLPEINSKNPNIRQLAERQAINTPIQGSASDMIKAAMVKIQGLIRVKKPDARMMLQIHDELLFDVGKGFAHEFPALIRPLMEEVLELDVPVKVDVKKGPNWLEMEDVS